MLAFECSVAFDPHSKQLLSMRPEQLHGLDFYSWLDIICMFFLALKLAITYNALIYNKG